LSRLQPALAVAFVLALASLELWLGLSRLDAIRAAHRRELLAGVERAHAELARASRALLDEERQHASYLASSPAVHAFLRDAARPPDEAGGEPAAGRDARAELEAQLLAYLASFPRIDRVRVLTPDGRVQLRCERIGDAVAVLPEALLEPEPQEDLRASFAGGGATGVVLSDLEVDRARVEVTPSERQVVHLVAHVAPDGGGEPGGGFLVLTAYASPLLNAVRDFAPRAGVQAYLVDPAGAYLAHPERERERGGARAGALERDHPELARALAAGLPEAGGGAVRGRGGEALVHGLGADVPWRLLTWIPDGALSSLAGELRREYLFVIGGMVVVTFALFGFGALFVRTSLRAFRLREREALLERIRRESQKYRALMEGAADLIAIVDPDADAVVESNALARSVLGLGDGAAGGRVPLERIVAPGSLARFRDGVRSALETARGPIAVPELRLTTLAGLEVPVDGRFAAIELADERVVEVSLRDLRRQKELERQLQIAERMASLGMLTAGVAHEINNPLEGIGNYLALLERDPGDAAKRARYLARVRHGFERIRDIVRDLRSSVGPRVEAGEADLAAVVRRALDLSAYARELEGARVELEGLEGELRVPGDAGRLEQVFLNLVLNAAQAMGGRGVLRIRVLGEREARRRSLTGVPAVSVAVEDEGPGIPEEHLDKLFDPFFTTGRGTGLGLAVSYGIVSAHGGALSAENRAEGGARFVVSLPARSSADDA